jgi:hypothetical protein
MPDSQIQAEVRYPPLFRLLNVVGILILLFMAITGWLAYSQEEATLGLPIAVVMIGLSFLWLLAVAASPVVVQFGVEQLTVRRWLGTARLGYQDITAVRQSRAFITIVTPSRTLRLYKLYANSDAKLMTALEKYVHAAKAVQEKRLYPKLPFTFQNATTGAVGIFVGMFLLLGGGIASFAYLITEPESIEPLQWVCIPFFGLMSTGFGLMFLYMLFRQYPRRYIFTPSEIRLRYLFHSESHPTRGLQTVEVKEDHRTVRGVPRTVYQLVFHYEDGSTFMLEPNGFAFPMDYIDAKEAQITAELATQIRHAHQLSSTAPTAKGVKTTAGANKDAAKDSQTGSSPNEGAVPISPPLTPSSPAHKLLEKIRQMEESEYFDQFETLRDELIALGPEAMPTILNVARNNNDHVMIDLLVTVLVDMAYPPAMPMMVEWLDHPNEEVRFAAAIALDMLAGGRFNINDMIVGGWVQHDQIQAIAPQIQEWYHSEGHKRLPSLTQWLAQRAAMPTYTEQEKRYNFIEMNPKWAMLGNGEVLQPEISYQLPRRQGVHIVGGVIRLHGDTADRDAVFEMESMQGIVQKVLIKENGRWLDITPHILSMTPHFRF